MSVSFWGYLPCVVIVSLNVTANGTLPAIEEIVVTDTISGNQDLADTATTPAKVSILYQCIAAQFNMLYLMWKGCIEIRVPWHSNFLTKIHFSSIVHWMILHIDNNDDAAVTYVMGDTSGFRRNDCEISPAPLLNKLSHMVDINSHLSGIRPNMLVEVLQPSWIKLLAELRNS
jgi:hypothetical protein